MKVAGPALIWLSAIAAASCLWWIFLPGYYSFDSAYLWWMSRGQPLNDTVPVVLALLWRAVASLGPDPQTFFALQLLLLWSGLAAVASVLPLPRYGQLLAMLVLGLWPPFLALQPHVWKDVWMVAGLLWSVGALLHAQRGSKGWLWFALLPLAFAVATRPNAITAVAPLSLWWAWIALRRPGASAPRAKSLVLGAFLVVGLLFAGSLPSRLSSAQPAPMWPFVALWDLAAVSMTSGRVLVPVEFRGEGASVETFAEGFREDSNVPVFASGAVVYIPEAGVDPAHLASLRRAWWSMLRDHPGEWASHRWRLTGHLFGWRRDPIHAAQVLAPGIVPYRDNPVVAPRESPTRQALQAWWDARAQGAWFVTWPYVLALFALGGWAWRRRDAAALAVAASGLANALPLIVAAPSAEFRYLGWTVLAALLTAILLFGNGPKHREKQSSG